MNTLPEIPYIPPILISEARREKVILFVGAAVSNLAGCPKWDEFANKTLEPLIDKEKLDEFKDLLQPRIKLQIALSLSNDREIDFKKILMEKVSEEQQEFYSYIAKIGNAIVTTNYDDLLDKCIQNDVAVKQQDSPDSDAYEERIYYKKEALLPKHLENKSLIHLHGSFKEPKTMILSTKQYLSHYANNKDNNVLNFLERLFEDYTVLFIGYGLKELEILEYIFLKGFLLNEKPKHYLLQGFSSEVLSHHLDNYYYKELGINLMAFSRKNNPKQLIEVLKYLSEKLAREKHLGIEARLKMLELEDEI